MASLLNVTRKVLFLGSLATVCCVGELQVVSASVSSLGGDLFLTYLPEFRTKSESSARPLLALSLSRLCAILLVLFWRNFFCVLLELFKLIWLVVLLFLRVLGLSFSLLATLLILSPRMLSASSFAVCFLQLLFRGPLPMALLLCLCLLLLCTLPALLPVFMLMGFAEWRLLGLIRIMLPCRPFCELRLGVLRRSSRHFILKIFSVLVILGLI